MSDDPYCEACGCEAYEHDVEDDPLNACQCGGCLGYEPATDD